MALETINKCLSDAICAMSRGRLDSDSQATSLLCSSDDVLEASKNYPQARSDVLFIFFVSTEFLLHFGPNSCYVNISNVALLHGRVEHNRENK